MVMLNNLVSEQLVVSPDMPTEETLGPSQTVALLHCYDLIDDFLDSIGISLETFCNEFVGSWMFGYVQALETVNVRTVLFCVSARVEKITRFKHHPSGATICLLPASQVYLTYRAFRNRLLRTYGGEPGQTFTDIQTSNPNRTSRLTVVKDLFKSIGSYLSTPLDTFAQALEQENCTAILCQEYEFARFDACVWLGRRLGLPVYASFQGGDETQSFLETLPRRLALKACSGVVIATQTEIERVQRTYSVPNVKVARVFNPIDLTLWQRQDQPQARQTLGIPDTARVVVWHGRVEIERKGLDVLLDAWEHICHERPGQDLRLWIVGMGSDSAKLRDRLTQQPLPGITWVDEFIHDRDRLQQYLSAADLYVMPSRQEGFPVAPLEAMACGLPVVAADAHGIPDILEQGELSGGIVVPRSSVMDLALTVGKVLDQPEWARELGCRARQRVEQEFAYESVGQQLRCFFFPEAPQP